MGKDWGEVRLEVVTVAHPESLKFVQEAAYKWWQNAFYLNYFSRKQHQYTCILWITYTWKISTKETVFPLLLLSDQQPTAALCSNGPFLFCALPGRNLQTCSPHRNAPLKPTLSQVICYKLKIILITRKWTCFIYQIPSSSECSNNTGSRLMLKYAKGLLA